MRRVLLFATLMFLLPVVRAQQAPGRVPTTTRLVAQFSTLEQQINTALRSNDQAGLKRLLADDFEVWTPSGTPIPSADWLKQATQHAPQSSELRHMAVRNFGPVAVVSFVEQQHTSTAGKERTESFFNIDVWRQNETGWRLEVRYQSPQAANPSAPRPTGKE